MWGVSGVLVQQLLAEPSVGETAGSGVGPDLGIHAALGDVVALLKLLDKPGQLAELGLGEPPGLTVADQADTDGIGPVGGIGIEELAGALAGPAEADFDLAIV